LEPDIIITGGVKMILGYDPATDTWT